jgi:glutaredoxin
MPAGRVVTLYTRPGCSLCLEAQALLEQLARPLGFTLDIVNIEADDSLLKRYLFEIPVVAVAGREVARAPIRTAAALADALRDAFAAAPGGTLAE